MSWSGADASAITLLVVLPRNATLHATAPQARQATQAPLGGQYNSPSGGKPSIHAEGKASCSRWRRASHTTQSVYHTRHTPEGAAVTDLRKGCAGIAAGGAAPGGRRSSSGRRPRRPHRRPQPHHTACLLVIVRVQEHKHAHTSRWGACVRRTSCWPRCWPRCCCWLAASIVSLLLRLLLLLLRRRRALLLLLCWRGAAGHCCWLLLTAAMQR